MRDNIQIVRAMLAAFAARDIDGVLSHIHPDVVFEPMLARVQKPGEPYRGHAGIRRYFEDIEGAWPDLTIGELQVQQAGDGVVAVGRVRAMTPQGPLDAPAVWTWRLQGGLIIEGRVHGDDGPARAALGLDPATGGR